MLSLGKIRRNGNIVQQFAFGISVAQLMEIYGLGRSTIYHIIKGCENGTNSRKAREERHEQHKGENVEQRVVNYLFVTLKNEAEEKDKILSDVELAAIAARYIPEYPTNKFDKLINLINRAKTLYLFRHPWQDSKLVRTMTFNRS